MSAEKNNSGNYRKGEKLTKKPTKILWKHISGESEAQMLKHVSFHMILKFFHLIDVEHDEHDNVLRSSVINCFENLCDNRKSLNRPPASGVNSSLKTHEPE